MNLLEISDEVEVCIQRLRAIRMMADGIVSRMPDQANAFARVSCDAEDAMIEVSKALTKLRKASS